MRSSHEKVERADGQRQLEPIGWRAKHRQTAAGLVNCHHFTAIIS
jgi:hypothetical protein